MQQRVVIPIAAALVGGFTTACILYRSSPYTLYAKGRRWWARRQDAADDTAEEDGEIWPSEGFLGPPQSRPLSTIGQLLTWKPPHQQHPLSATEQQQQQLEQTQQLPASTAHDPCSCSTPLTLPHQPAAAGPAGAAGGGEQPQLLVCHDMMGGYQGDALLCGSADWGHYRLWHWDCIDVFVYFSHHMVTLPPTCWTHAAHKHGVKVLGTFITEFGQGKRRCNRLFASHASAEAVADQLVRLAVHYGFEGWLVNIENSLSAQQVLVVQHFVGYLRARMRSAMPHGMVVWYDAVTTAGELRWQNQLSALNAPFFDLADALFVNYTWTPQTLPVTVAAAAARAPEVYMGVDVHGRGSYGGGGHNVGLALRAAAAAGLSAALFAPGWVYENLQRSRFVELQEQWWHKVQADWGFSHAVLHSLPFKTAFNAGAGRAWFSAGACTASGAAAAAAAAAAAGVDWPDSDQQPEGAAAGAGNGWFNMLLMDTLHTIRDPITQQVLTGPIVGQLASCTAFNGGSCLVLCRQQQEAEGKGIADSTAAAGVAGVAAPCCSLAGAGAAAAGSGHGGKVLLLLQLFKASVPVQQDLLLKVSCVYAAPGGGSSSSSSSTGPALWVSTEPAGQPPAGAAAGADAVQVDMQRVIHLPVRAAASASAAAAGAAVQQLLLADGQPSGVSVEVLPGAPRVDSLGPVSFVDDSSAPAAAPVPAAAAAGGGDGSAASAAGSAAGSLWESDLAGALAGWQWQRVSWLLPVSAGRSITGIGVAVGQGSRSGGSGEQAAPLIEGVLGQVEVGSCSWREQQAQQEQVQLDAGMSTPKVAAILGQVQHFS